MSSQFFLCRITGGTNLLYDEYLCDLPAFLCDASLPSTVAPLTFCYELDDISSA